MTDDRHAISEDARRQRAERFGVHGELLTRARDAARDLTRMASREWFDPEELADVKRTIDELLTVGRVARNRA